MEDETHTQDEKLKELRHRINVLRAKTNKDYLEILNVCEADLNASTSTLQGIVLSSINAIVRTIEILTRNNETLSRTPIPEETKETGGKQSGSTGGIIRQSGELDSQPEGEAERTRTANGGTEKEC